MSKGFFSPDQTKSKTRPDGKVYSCAACGLYKGALSPKMKPFGNFKKKIMNIGEAPGEVEDERGKQWQGKTGQLLRKTYQELGIDLFDDCININTVNCRPKGTKGNRPPTPHEINCCRRIVMKAIEYHQPHIIVLLGGSAIQSIIGYRWKKDLGGVYKWRGWTIPDRDFDTWIIPTFHPSYVERSDAEEVMTIWKQDLKKVVEKSEEDLPKYYKPRIKIIEDLSPLNDIKADRVAFDYETTGIKPHAKGHRIICASIAYTPNHAYSFMIPKTRKECKPLLDLLANPFIGKMAHNMKYENLWSIFRMRQPVINWEWDSIIAAHQLDNRRGVTSLKFQTYVNFGIVDYASGVKPYLESGSKDGNAHNRIMELISKPGGAKQLLTYCGYDSVYEYRLAALQQEAMDYDFLPF
jgi:DNA polymerase